MIQLLCWLRQHYMQGKCLCTPYHTQQMWQLQSADIYGTTEENLGHLCSNAYIYFNWILIVTFFAEWVLIVTYNTKGSSNEL